MARVRPSRGDLATLDPLAFPAAGGSPLGAASEPPSPLYYPPQFLVYPGMRAHYAGTSPRGGDAPGPGKASMVEELKALILASEAGTGEIARHIEEATFSPRHNCFTSLLQLASRSRAPDKAVEIFEAMQSVAGIAPNTFSYSALISALARVGNWQAAERYFRELKDRAAADPDLRPNTVTYAALISAYEKGRQLDKALAAFEEQVADGVEPDVITYASLLSACERAGAVERAVALLDAMHAQGLAGPPQMYNSVIAACGARWRPALEAFLGMQCAGVEASAQSATLLMASLCAGRQRDHALALLREVAASRWNLSLTAYSSLLSLLSAAGDWREADRVHAHMAAAGVRPDAAAAAALVTAHALGGDQPGAEQMHAYFVNLGVVPAPRPASRGAGESSASAATSVGEPRAASTGAGEPRAASTGAGELSDGDASLPISVSESLESEPLAMD